MGQNKRAIGAVELGNCVREVTGLLNIKES